MSLEICEVNDPEKLKLKNSILFKGRFKLILEPSAECKFTRISEDIYSKQQKVYFPLFENMIFTKASSDDRLQSQRLVFKGNLIQDDEIEMIKSLIKENIEKENARYKEYKKELEKEISEIVNSLGSEISNQKDFLDKEFLTKHQYNEHIKTLLSAYLDIIRLKLDKDVNLKSEDRNLIIKFYENMIEGIGKNNITN
jgi:methanogenic corrinoid protein MtbC1